MHRRDGVVEFSHDNGERMGRRDWVLEGMIVGSEVFGRRKIEELEDRGR